jgi:hypothetical protein
LDEDSVRLAYDEVDDAVLDPSTAAVHGAQFRMSGYVEASGLFIKLPKSLRGSAHIALTLVIEPVESFAFDRLDEGIGEVIAGPFHSNSTGGRVEGVIPGDLTVTGASVPQAWFETTALVRNGDVVEFRHS